MLYLLLLLTVIVWGWTFVATKLCLPYMSPAELLGLRLMIGLPVLYAVLKVRRIPLDFTGVSKKRLLAGSAVLTLHFLIQITGLKYTTATNTGWIIAVTPLVMAVLSFVFLREKINRYQIGGIVIATIGILLLVSRGKIGELGWLSSVGDWLVLGSAHTWAIYTVITRDVSRAKDPLVVTFGILFPATVIMFGYMLFTSDWSKFLHLPVEPMVALLFLAIIGLALAHWCWQIAVAKIGAARAGIFLYLEPLATTVLAVPLLHEAFGTFTALGGALVLFGVWWAQRKIGRVLAAD